MSDFDSFFAEFCCCDAALPSGTGFCVVDGEFDSLRLGFFQDSSNG